MSEPLWISEDIAKAIHAAQIAQHGGSPDVSRTSADSRAGVYGVNYPKL